MYDTLHILPLLLQKEYCQHIAFEPALLLWSQQQVQQLVECQQQCLPESDQPLEIHDLLYFQSLKFRNTNIELTGTNERKIITLLAACHN